MTISKSKGLIFKIAGIDKRKNHFSHNKFNLVYSRVSRYAHNLSYFCTKNKNINAVYREVLE